MKVGDPNLDHKCWERPEDMDTPRTVYKITAQNPGSDVAAETAAALAAASIVFKTSDPSYSNKLLNAALKVNHHTPCPSHFIFLSHYTWSLHVIMLQKK